MNGMLVTVDQCFPEVVTGDAFQGRFTPQPPTPPDGNLSLYKFTAGSAMLSILIIGTTIKPKTPIAAQGRFYFPSRLLQIHWVSHD